MTKIEYITNQKYDIIVSQNSLDITGDFLTELINETERDYYNSFNTKKTNQKSYLTNILPKYESVLEAFVIMNRVYLKKYIDEKDKENKEVLNNHFLIAQTHINKLQNQYISNIIFHIQQIGSKRSLRLAWIVAIASTILAIVSINRTIHYGKNPTSCTCCPMKLEPVEISQITTEQDSSKITDNSSPLDIDTSTRTK